MSELRPKIGDFIRRRAQRVASDEYDDAFADLSLEVASRLSTTAEFPKAWFGEDDVDPTSHEKDQFDNWVWIVTRRRHYDRLRRFYSERASLGVRVGLDETLDLPVPTGDPHAKILAKRTLRLVADELDRFSPEERELLIHGMAEELVAGGNERAVSASDRVRLHRMRKSLASRVAKLLLKRVDESEPA